MSDTVIEPEIVDEKDNTGDQEGLPTDTKAPVLRDDAFKFAALLASGECRSVPEAYKKAFPSKASSKWVTPNAYKLAKSPKIREYIDTIQQATRLQIVLEMPEAYERVKKIAMEAKSERVKLDANLELMDRGGMKAPQRIENLQIGIFGSLDTESMKDILRKNLAKHTEEKK